MIDWAKGWATPPVSEELPDPDACDCGCHQGDCACPACPVGEICWCSCLDLS